MTLAQTINLIGLICITVGSICAALGSPSPIYKPDGSVTVGQPDQSKRVTAYQWQKNFHLFLLLIAFGAFLQAVAMFLPTGNEGQT